MKKFSFIDNPQSYNTDDAFVAHISDVKSKEDLFKQLSIVLNFPVWGFNWDALFDCFRDFNWIKKYKIILVHDNLPYFDGHNLKIYLEILLDSVKDWKDGENHSFEVIFPKHSESLILEYFKKPH